MTEQPDNSEDYVRAQRIQTAIRQAREGVPVHVIAKQWSGVTDAMVVSWLDWAGVKVEGGGLRYDTGKPRFDLIPPDFLMALAHLYGPIGAAKYAERNWEKGMSWGRCFRALMSHAWKFWRGERYDAETGVHHMICCAWNAAALFCYDMRKVGQDDRHQLADVQLWTDPQDTKLREVLEVDIPAKPTFPAAAPAKFGNGDMFDTSKLAGGQ